MTTQMTARSLYRVSLWTILSELIPLCFTFGSHSKRVILNNGVMIGNEKERKKTGIFQEKVKNWRYVILRWLNKVLVVCEYTSFAKSWREKGCSSQAETWQVQNTLMKDFAWLVKFDIFVVSMATWTIEYNLKISLLLSLQKTSSLDLPINLHVANYN